MEAVEDFKQDEVANIPNSLLISASYIGKTKKVSLKFYNPESQKIYLWEDKTGHQPYCFSKMAPEDLGFLSERDDVVEIKTVKKIDTLKDKEIEIILNLTIPRAHYEVSKMALENGKHSYAEKPMAVNFENGKEFWYLYIGVKVREKPLFLNCTISLSINFL